MPIYEFACDPCAHTFEELRRISDQSLPKCPRCGAPTRRVISLTSFRLRGSGWYATDYKNVTREKKAASG